METEDSTKYLLQKQNIGSSRGGGGGTNSEKNQCAIVFTQFWYADSENLGHFLQKWFLRVLLKVSMTS